MTIDENIKRIFPGAKLIGTKVEPKPVEAVSKPEYSPAKERIRQAIKEGNLRSLKKNATKQDNTM